MPELLDRRARDLQRQFEALPAELKHWQQLSEAGQPFEKHHSQIRALAAQMLDLNTRVQTEWNATAEFTALVKAQLRCAAVHSVWNFFREKFVLRLDAHLGNYLKAADAYAWACYEPVLEAERAKAPGSAYREPPLVTFHAEVSPWALGRQSRYETAPAPGGASGEEAFERVRSALPIPVIGIPWHTAQFLPHLPVLAHETGHVVEADFNYGPRVEAELLRDLGESKLCEGWSCHWRKEVFADLFACYAAGPAFVWSLLESLPESPAVVAKKARPSAGEPPQWGQYPPATLRVLLNTAGLAQLGFAQEAKEIEQYWRQAYPEHAMVSFESEVLKVAEAVYRIAAFPPKLNYANLLNQQLRVKRSIDGTLSLPEAYNPRVLVAVARDLHNRGLDLAQAQATWAKLINYIVQSRPPGMLDTQQKRAKAFVPTKTAELAELLFAEMEPD